MLGAATGGLLQCGHVKTPRCSRPACPLARADAAWLALHPSSGWSSSSPPAVSHCRAGGSRRPAQRNPLKGSCSCTGNMAAWAPAAQPAAAAATTAHGSRGNGANDNISQNVNSRQDEQMHTLHQQHEQQQPPQQYHTSNGVLQQQEQQDEEGCPPLQHTAGSKGMPQGGLHEVAKDDGVSASQEGSAHNSSSSSSSSSSRPSHGSSSSGGSRPPPEPLPAPALTRAITSCRTVGALQQLWQQHGPAMNPVHCSALLVRLAKLSAGPWPPAPQQQQQQQQQHQQQQQGVAVSRASAASRALSLAQAVASQLAPHLQRSRNCRQASNATWALARLGPGAAPPGWEGGLVEVLQGRQGLLVAAATPQELANLCWALPQLGLPQGHPLWQQMVEGFSSKAGEASGTDLVCFACALVQQHQQALDHYHQHQHQQQQKVSPVAQGRSVSPASPPPAVAAAPPPQQQPSGASARQALAGLCQQLQARLHQLTAREAANLLWCCGALELRHWDLLTALAGRLEQLVSTCNGRDMTHALWALSRVQVAHAGLWRAAAAHSAAWCHSLSHQDAVLLLWASVAARTPEAGLALQLWRHVAQLLPVLGAGDLALLAYAAAREGDGSWHRAQLVSLLQSPPDSSTTAAGSGAVSGAAAAGSPAQASGAAAAAQHGRLQPQQQQQQAHVEVGSPSAAAGLPCMPPAPMLRRPRHPSSSASAAAGGGSDTGALHAHSPTTWCNTNSMSSMSSLSSWDEGGEQVEGSPPDPSSRSSSRGLGYQQQPAGSRPGGTSGRVAQQWAGRSGGSNSSSRRGLDPTSTTTPASSSSGSGDDGASLNGGGTAVTATTPAAAAQECLQQLGCQLQRQDLSWQPQQVQQVLWAFAHSGVELPSSSRRHLHALAAGHLPQCTPGGLALLAWLAARHPASPGDSHLLTAVTAAAHGQLAALAPQQVALLCWAVGRQGPGGAAAVGQQEVVADLAAAVAGCASRMGPQSVAMVVWSLARLGHYDQEALSALAARAQQLLLLFKPKELSMVLCGLEALQYSPRSWFDHVASHLLQHAASWDGRSLAKAAWVFASTKHGSWRHLVRSLGDVLVTRPVSSWAAALTPHEVTAVAWAYSRPGCTHRPLLRALARSAAPRVSCFANHDLVQLVTVLAQAGVSSYRFLDAVHQHLQQQHPSDHVQAESQQQLEEGKQQQPGQELPVLKQQLPAEAQQQPQAQQQHQQQQLMQEEDMVGTQPMRLDQWARLAWAVKRLQHPEGEWFLHQAQQHAADSSAEEAGRGMEAGEEAGDDDLPAEGSSSSSRSSSNALEQQQEEQQGDSSATAPVPCNEQTFPTRSSGGSAGGGGGSSNGSGRRASSLHLGRGRQGGARGVLGRPPAAVLRMGSFQMLDDEQHADDMVEGHLGLDAEDAAAAASAWGPWHLDQQQHNGRRGSSRRTDSRRSDRAVVAAHATAPQQRQ